MKPTLDTNTPIDHSKGINIQPAFNLAAFDTEAVETKLKELVEKGQPISHEKLLAELLKEVEPVNFQNVAFPDTEELKSKKQELEQLTADQHKNELTAERKLLAEINSKLATQRASQRHIQVIVIEQLLKIAKQNSWGLCTNTGFVYLYNGAFWKVLEGENLQYFLGQGAEKLGVDHYTAEHYEFKRKLVEQFKATAFLSSPKPPAELVLINLKNGTYEINAKTGSKGLREFRAGDFLKHQLPFDYEPTATAPLFQKYLDKVVPEKEMQQVLAEYLGWVFVRHSSQKLKLEKALVLYGFGANGKSVFFQIATALFGEENCSTYSIQNLTLSDGYYRAAIANKLINYASEISNKLESAYFKQLVSGEPVEARVPFGTAQIVSDYAKLIFNCNELPIVTDHTYAFFRRFLIVPFNVTIADNEKDPELASKIIENELSGVFNWVLEGLGRLIDQQKFTYCESCESALLQYQKESDTVALFLEENPYKPDPKITIELQTLFEQYKQFCVDCGNRFVSKGKFRKRIELLGFSITKRNVGLVVFAYKEPLTFPNV